MLKLVKKIIKEVRYYKNNRGKFKTFWNWKNGFFAETVEVCGINKSNYKDFLSNKQYKEGHPYNGAYSSILDNKLYLPLLLKDYPEVVPTYFFFKDKSGFLKLSGENRGHRYFLADFFELLHTEKRLCLKHTHSSIGVGFMLVQYENGEYRINNEVKSKETLSAIIENLDEYIVTAYVKQHEYASNICSTSCNSIRMLCAWDYSKKSFYLVRCFHRFGCNGNVVDNVGSGNGILVFVDPETGILQSKGAINIKKSGDKPAENIIHPDKNIPLTGLEIPKFNEIKNKVLEIANTMSYLRYVGFDIVVTKDGFKVLETNSLSSLDVTQQKIGFLKDERMKKIFKK